MTPLNLLLIEDDPDDVRDLTALLNKTKAAKLSGAQYSEITLHHASNQAEADEAVKKMQYDIVLLDLQYPLGDEPLNTDPGELQGMKWLPELRMLQPRAAIVVLTKFADVPIVVKAIRDHHANDFVAKTEPFENIVARIQTAWRNARDLQHAITLRNEYRALLRTLGSRVFAKDVGGLISSVNTRLARIAQEIQSGDPSAVGEAPKRIRETIKRLSEEHAEATKLLEDLDEPVREVDVVKELIEPLEGLYERPIDVSQARGQSIKVWTARNDLTAALREVVQNAVDTGAGTVAVSVEKAGKDAVIHIRDNGGGFSKEAKSRIFKGRYTSSKNQGTYHQGLGLYIARRMMRSIGGEVRVENERDGAHVTLSVRNLRTA